MNKLLHEIEKHKKELEYRRFYRKVIIDFQFLLSPGTSTWNL